MSLNSKKVVFTDRAPEAIGPYSQAIKAGNLIFTSGQIPLEPAGGQIVSGGAAEQMVGVIENLKAVLAAAGAGLEDVVKTTLYIKNMEDFRVINEVYGSYFKVNPPARSCVEVARLPKDVLVELEAIAMIKD